MVADLVKVWSYSNIGDKEQNVVHCMGGSQLIRNRKEKTH